MKTQRSMRLPKHEQSGAALIVVLLLLLVVTLLGLASMRGAIMQERMAANTAARGVAFQVAEAGLRQAEILARDATLAFPASGCSEAVAPWSIRLLIRHGQARTSGPAATVIKVAQR